jgi:sugar phosphate isomerase/epimerase
MITYAAAGDAMIAGGHLTPAFVNAIRNAKLRNMELACNQLSIANEDTKRSLEITRELVKEKAIRIVSVHLPFYGDKLWDPSVLDEEVRKDVSARFSQLILNNLDLMAPEATIHASHEPPLEEHPQHIDQFCKTVEEMIPALEAANMSLNVEFLPRTCVGHNVEELEIITRRFDAKHVNINFDVNHIMAAHKDLPAMIQRLAPRIHAFHISDYDGIDELHWHPGQGLIDWPAVMKAIKAIDHDLLLILETTFQLGGRPPHRIADPCFALKQLENDCYFLENCDRIVAEQNAFQVPGN